MDSSTIEDDSSSSSGTLVIVLILVFFVIIIIIAMIWYFSGSTNNGSTTRKGAKGDPGAPGAPGPQGPIGPPGEPGGFGENAVYFSGPIQIPSIVTNSSSEVTVALDIDPLLAYTLTVSLMINGGTSQSFIFLPGNSLTLRYDAFMQSNTLVLRFYSNDTGASQAILSVAAVPFENNILPTTTMTTGYVNPLAFSQGITTMGLPRNNYLPQQRHNNLPNRPMNNPRNRRRFNR